MGDYSKRFLQKANEMGQDYKNFRLGRTSFILGLMGAALFVLFFILPEIFPYVPRYYLANFVIFSSAFFASISSIIVGVIYLFPGKRYEKKLSIVGIILSSIVILLGFSLLISSLIS